MRMWQHVITVLLITVESSSAQCTLSYDQRPGMTVSGSQTQGSITSREGCEAACQANADCVGYDWTTANQCRLALGIPDTPTTSDPESTHYRRIETCVSGASTCTYEYIGQYTISPSDRNGPVLTGDCGGECNTNDGCAGYVRDVNECLLSFTTETADRMSSSTHGMYNKTTCGPAQAAPVCDPITFTMFADFHVSGGVADSNGDGNVVLCQTICVGDSACVGVDFTDSGSCYIIINPDTAITPDLSSTHYGAHRICTTGANVCGYDQYGSFVPNAGQTETASQTFDECIALCNNDGGCTQVAYDVSTSTCVTSTGTAAQKTGNSAYQMLRKQSTCPVAPAVSTAPSTAPVTTTPLNPVCEDPVWTTLVGFSSLGGSPGDGISTVVACQQQCIDDTACLAIDFEATALPPCWLHLSAAYANPVNFRTRSGVTQYILVERCPQATTTTATQPTTTTTVTFSNTAVPTTTQTCVPDWTEVVNTHSSGGAREPGITELEVCQTACAARADCLGLDYDVSTPSCWLHSSAESFDVKQGTTNVNQFILNDRCPQACVGEWLRIDNMHGLNGVAQIHIETLEDCQAECIRVENCVALDHDTHPDRVHCWFFVDSGYAQSAESGINHYKLTRCGSGHLTTTASGGTTEPVCPIFQEHENKHALNGMPQAGRTIEECKAECIANELCKGVDFDEFASIKCYTFNTVETALIERPATNHYELLCRAGETLPPSVTTSAGDSTTQGCNNIYTIIEDTYANGATMRPQFATLADCLQGCVVDDICVAVDSDDDPFSCWFHSDRATLDNRQTRVGVHQHVLSRCVTEGTTSSFPTGTTSVSRSTTEVCDNVFTTNGGKHSHGAAEQVGFTNLQDCQDGCVANADCVAIDSSVRPFSCWFHLDAANLATTETRTGVNQYVLTRCATPDCPKFEEFVGMHVAGGIPQADIGSLAECKAACDVANDCHGIDYAKDATDVKCFLHNTANTRTELEPETGVTHYAMICKTGESLPTGPDDTTSVTTQSTTVGVTTRAPCTAGFIETINQQALTPDAPYTEIPSATMCLQLCARYPIQCYGANYDRVARTCSLVLVENYTVQASTNSLFRAILCS